jgi:undecaprenyl pyrophosphate phosphatase UppP
LAHQQIVASFEMANEFTIVLAISSILLITVNYENKFKELLVQGILGEKKKNQRIATFDYLKKPQKNC